MRHTIRIRTRSCVTALVTLASALLPLHSEAVDLESFEFNDPFFTTLDLAVNTANPGNFWSVDFTDLTDSETDGAGNFRIAKFNDAFADNFLQIDNVDSSTVGSRYIVATMNGWNFRNNVPGEGEELRFAFLNDDTGNSGSTVAAEVRIDRNTDTEAIELRGLAVGAGSSNIADRATLATTQPASSPFTMVLELNKTSNTYEVFWKDGTNPSQSLGIGQVSPGRDGNSVRMVVNNNFGSDLTEFLDIDRIAVTDTNPLTDLLTLEVDRISGETKLINTTGSALSGLEAISITSGVGALDASGWMPITDNYDNSAGPGNGSVDADDDWAITSSTTGVLSEAVQGGNGGSLSIGQEVVLSTITGSPWLQNPTEDLQVELLFSGGVTRTANVNFVGNGGERFEVGDLTFDGIITADDWTVFIAGSEADMTGLSTAERYQMGDLDGDGVNSFIDFGLFEAAFDAANGIGSLQLLIAGVPEPSSAILIALGASAIASGRVRRGSV